MMDPELVPKLMASGTIEVAPLACMRGRTPNSSFVVLDEAQNTTPEQIKMFLTRLGFGTKMVVTGDITQVDLPQGVSGLRLVTRVLKDIDDIESAYLTSDDVVRHSASWAASSTRTARGDDEQRLAAQARSATRRPSSPTAPSVCGGAPGGPRDRLPKREDGRRSRSRTSPASRPTRRCCCALTAHNLAELNVSAEADVAILLVDEGAMEPLHVQWMDEPGPDRRAELPDGRAAPRGGTEDTPHAAGLLGDIVLCPQVAGDPGHAGHPLVEELILLTTHGLLHLLGFDHAEPDEEREMFGLQRDLIVAFHVSERRRRRT